VAVMRDMTKVSFVPERLSGLARTARRMSGGRLGSASEALVTALPEILALSPTSSLAVIFSLIAISSVRRGEER